MPKLGVIACPDRLAPAVVIQSVQVGGDPLTPAADSPLAPAAVAQSAQEAGNPLVPVEGNRLAQVAGSHLIATDREASMLIRCGLIQIHITRRLRHPLTPIGPINPAMPVPTAKNPLTMTATIAGIPMNSMA
jgi:hypothetical protein